MSDQIIKQEYAGSADIPVFYCLLSRREADSISVFEESVSKLCSDKLYNLRFVLVDDWDS